MFSAEMTLMHDATAAANNGCVNTIQREYLPKCVADVEAALAELSKIVDEHSDWMISMWRNSFSPQKQRRKDDEEVQKKRLQATRDRE